MLDIAALQQFRRERFFALWDGFVPQESVAASEESIRTLIDALIALSPTVSESEVRKAVHECVVRFNELDQGWMCTIEREDICDCVERIVDLCGMNGSGDWIEEDRDW